MVASPPAAAASGKLLEMRILRPTPELMNQKFWGGHGFCIFTNFPHVLLHVKVLEPLFQSKTKQSKTKNKTRLDRVNIFREKGKAVESIQKKEQKTVTTFLSLKFKKNQYNVFILGAIKLVKLIKDTKTQLFKQLSFSLLA